MKKGKLKAPKKSSSWWAAIVGVCIFSPRNDYYEENLTTKGRIKVQILFVLMVLAIGIGLTCRVVSIYGKEVFALPQLIVLLLNIPLAALRIGSLREISKLEKKNADEK